MTTIEHYRAQLEECERFADQSTNRHDKIVWNRLMQHYLDLIVTLQMKLRNPTDRARA
jgi:hypothetical protein